MLNLFYAAQSDIVIFNFPTVITSLALISIIYTITDITYKFRIAVLPLPLLKITFWFVILIGCGTLLSDLWFCQHWPLPNIVSNQAILQTIFESLFLGVVTLWMYYAFIQPPKFGTKNYKKYALTLYKIIVKGSDKKLAAIASELSRSANSLL